MKTKQSFMLSLILLFIFSIVLNAQIKSKIEHVAGKAVKTKIWQGREIQFVEREIAVKVILTATKTEISDLIKTMGGRVINSFDERGWGLIELPVDKDEILVINDLLKLPFVSAAEPNMVTSADIEPNDPYFNGTSPAAYPYQWALKNTGQTPPTGTNDADVDAPEAWNITTGNSDVILAILDSGIPMLNGSLSHPDLDDPNKIILGQDCVGDGEGVRDRLGHGTHVAGIAAAESNNGIGVSGVAWNSKILVIQVFDEYGSGSYSAFYNGVVYAVDYQRNNQGKKVVINFSGGGSASQLALDAVIYANTYGVPIVASAGNNYGGAVKYPAAYSSSYSNVIAVSATDATDTFAPYSNQGSQVCVSAPGGYGGTSDADDIYSTTPNYTFTYGEWYGITQNYGYMAGTSMAAPHVTGIAGLLLSVNANLTPAQIRNIIQQSAEDKGTTGFDNYYGYGRVNAYKAVKYTLEHYGGKITQNLTIPSGETWSFYSGATVTFSSGKKISVYGGGSLTANGATFQGNGTAGYWHSISFFANSSGTIQSSTIRDALCGIYATTNANVTISNNTITNNSLYGISSLSNSNITVSNCTISNNGTGINASSITATITGNSILNNTNYGINATNIAGNPNWYSNTLHGNGYAVVLNNTSPYIAYSTISDNAHGVVINSSFPNFCPPDNSMGYNAITCSATPLFKADNSSTVFMGYWSNGGYNSVFGSELPDMQALNSSGIWAGSTYWGSSQPAVYADGTSWIYTGSPLTSDPNPGSCSGYSAPSSFVINSSAIKINVSSTLDDKAAKYEEAIANGRGGYFQKAKETLLTLIDGEYDHKYSPLALLAFYEFTLNEKYIKNKSGLTDTLNTDLNDLLAKVSKRAKGDSLRPYALRFLAREAALAHDTRGMISYNKEIVANYPNSSNELAALYDLTTYHSEIEQDFTKANEYYSRMVKAYPKEDLTIFAGINLGVNKGSLKKEIFANANQLPKDYNLGNAFPNPFNPTTTITYQLPKSGSVTLKIFDILGNEVKTLVNENKEMGRYTVQFDASSLASGMYVYRLRANDYTSTKKMMLLK